MVFVLLKEIKKNDEKKFKKIINNIKLSSNRTMAVDN